MKKLDYLKRSIINKQYNVRNWILSCFAITKFDESKLTLDEQNNVLMLRDWGYEIGTTKEKIEDANKNEPAFKFSDVITIDHEWYPGLKAPIETTIGRLLLNLICVYSSFGDRIEYFNKQFTVKDIEKKISPLLRSKPKDPKDRDPQFIYTDENENFGKNIQFMEGISSIVNITATPKNIIPAPGISEFKNELIKKYEGRLTNPVEFTKFETELKTFDNKWLEDDPTNNIFMSGKVKDVSRKKLHLTVGMELGFSSSQTKVPVLNSLSEGWPDSDEEITSMMNSIRYGSYARGAETINGGVTAKKLLRAANNFVILDGDCESPFGIERVIYKPEQIVGRTVISNSGNIYIDSNEKAKKYVGKMTTYRSPQYCQAGKDSNGAFICKVCASPRLSGFKNGVAIFLTELSSAILYISMSAMHGKTLSTAKLDINTSFT